MTTMANRGKFFKGPVQKGFGLQPRSLQDWLLTATGGQRAAAYGNLGPGILLRKDITTAGDTTVATDFFTNTFGAKVWDSLNSQTRFFNLIRKVAWGNTTGWRIRSGRNRSTQGVSEIEALPTIDSPDLQAVHVQPSFIVTSLGVSALAQFLATLEGGIGDALAVAQETAEVDHLKTVNQMLLAPSEVRIEARGGATEITLPDGAGEYAFIGDTFNYSGNETDDRYVTIGGLADDVATITETGGVSAADAVLYTRSRGGMWSLADIVSQDGRTANGVALTNGARYGSLAYGGRTAGGWNAAGHISGNSGTLRHLTTGQLDRVIQQIRVNGFQPDLLVTGVEQEVRLGTILQANQHFMGDSTFQVKQGGEASLPGYQTGFEVATYKKIPLFTEVDTSPVWQLAAGGDAKRGTDVYVLDTRYLEIPVLYTTQYMESRDYIHNNLVGVKAIFLTAANIRCMNFRAQGRITDLSDGINLQ